RPSPAAPAVADRELAFPLESVYAGGDRVVAPHPPGGLRVLVRARQIALAPQPREHQHRHDGHEQRDGQAGSQPPVAQSPTPSRALDVRRLIPGGLAATGQLTSFMSTRETLGW